MAKRKGAQKKSSKGEEGLEQASQSLPRPQPPQRIQAQETLETLRFLNEDRGSIEELCKRYALKASRHELLPELVQLKYSQIASPFQEIIPRECRGLILEEQTKAAGTQRPTYRVVAYPYKRFFNQDEKKLRDEVDWTTARVYEKLDGSLCTLYWYSGAWRVASSGLPDARGTIKCSIPTPGANSEEGEGAVKEGVETKEETTTFADLFWNIWNQVLKYRLPTDTNYCYMFEMLTPRLPIIVPPQREAIVLHGARNLTTLQEVFPEAIAKFGWECVRSFPLHTLEETLAASKSFQPGESEGFVVCDAQFRRVKIKSPLYVALAHLSLADKNKMNKRHMLKIVRENEGDEFLAYFPQWKRLHSEVRSAYEEFCTRLLHRSAHHYHNLPSRTEIDRLARLDKVLMALAPEFFSQWIATDRNLASKGATDAERRLTLKQSLLRLDLGLLEKCMTTPHAEASNPHAYSTIEGRAIKEEGAKTIPSDKTEPSNDELPPKQRNQKSSTTNSQPTQEREASSASEDLLRSNRGQKAVKVLAPKESKPQRRSNADSEGSSGWEVVTSRRNKRSQRGT